MVVDREGLWFRVLSARYGGVEGRLQPCGREGSVWWKDIASIRDGSSSMLGSWFLDSLRLRLGNGVDTLLWLDRWVSDVPFCEKFRRLYDLSDNKLANVAQMFQWGWDVGGEAWKWRRRLWVWEEELLKECRLFLLTVTLQVDYADTWRWTPDIANGYTTSGAYRLLTNTTQVNVHSGGS
ncbi:hypothetical protein MTR_4g076130 [Medicago truncatula]|uniref:Uncharacterized protein n=1 Tax=Medicago truncatula TaxID=3880 RepID=G7JQJ5_MEDTR|nr:hypothetical protein MTR_4g076130 [Medicago truncatula]